jgi:hypothetical protein
MENAQRVIEQVEGIVDVLNDLDDRLSELRDTNYWRGELQCGALLGELQAIVDVAFAQGYKIAKKIAKEAELVARHYRDDSEAEMRDARLAAKQNIGGLSDGETARDQAAAAGQ